MRFIFPRPEIFFLRSWTSEFNDSRHLTTSPFFKVNRSRGGLSTSPHDRVIERSHPTSTSSTRFIVLWTLWAGTHTEEERPQSKNGPLDAGFRQPGQWSFAIALPDPQEFGAWAGKAALNERSKEEPVKGVNASLWLCPSESSISILSDFYRVSCLGVGGKE